MPLADAYSVLGLPPTATMEEVKQNYKHLAAVFHPDKGGYTEAMVLLNQAYEKIKGKKRGVEKMQPSTRLSREDLVELIDATEAAGNDATELRNLLAEVPDEGRKPPPARQGGGRSGGRAVLEEEEPLRDRLNREVGRPV